MTIPLEFTPEGTSPTTLQQRSPTFWAPGTPPWNSFSLGQGEMVSDDSSVFLSRCTLFLLLLQQLRRAGDPCPTYNAGQAQPSNESRLTSSLDKGSNAFLDRRSLLYRVAGWGWGVPQQAFIPPRSEISLGWDEEAPGPELNKAHQTPLPLNGRSSADGGAARGRGFWQEHGSL